MRKLLGTAAVVLGVAGVLLCAAAAGSGWWAAVSTTTRLDRVAARLDHGLSEVELQLSRVESRVNAVRSDLNEIREAAETIAVENPELPRVRAEIDRILDRLVPAFDRVDVLADSLWSASAGLRSAAEIVDQIRDKPEATVRARNAADKIDRAAESLNGLRIRVATLKSVQAVQLTQELVTLAREAIAGSELLAEGLASAREEIAVLRGRTVEWRDKIVTWIYVAAIGNTVVWLWGGLAQLCLIGWGRRRFDPIV